MKINKPSFWDTKKFSVISILLIPFSIIYKILLIFKRKITKVRKFNIPIICVGNIYIGGTGKTPSAIFIANELQSKQKNPVIVRKFYKSHFDEHCLTEHYFKNLILDKNRINALKKAENNNFDAAILDDGYQDYRIKKDLNILCFNSNQMLGNGLVFPAGPLREDLNRIKDAHIIIINGAKKIDFERKILDINTKCKIFYSKYSPLNIENFKNNKLMAIAGIGNPTNFFDILSKNKLECSEKLIYPDHYEFSKNVLEDLISLANKKKLKIITTEKDHHRIKHFNLDKIDFLKVKLEIEDKGKFINEILKIYD